MATAIVIFTFAGLAVLFGTLIADSIGHARHTRWLEENNRRRHGLKE